MANQLKVGLVQTIYTLLEQGWSRRRIARTLGVDRGTVTRYANKARAPANAAGAPPGSGGQDASSAPANADAPTRPPVQPSRCEALREIILTKLEQGLSAKRIHQDLIQDHGFEAKYTAYDASYDVWASRVRCRFDAWSAHRVTKPRSTSAKAPQSSAPTARRSGHTFSASS